MNFPSNAVLVTGCSGMAGDGPGALRWSAVCRTARRCATRKTT